MVKLNRIKYQIALHKTAKRILAVSEMGSGLPWDNLYFKNRKDLNKHKKRIELDYPDRKFCISRSFVVE